jgi:hypothetical protein
MERSDHHNSQAHPGSSPGWIQLCTAITGFERLRQLHLWADHNSQRSWTVVNERAFLAPLHTLLTANPHLQIHVSLPKLHPKYESPERHFVHDCAPPPYRITRRLRQRFHAVRQGTRYYKNWVPDFPITYEIDSSDEELETVEERERQWWQKGVDVEGWVRD